MSAPVTHAERTVGTGSPERRPLVTWLVLSILAALLAWFGFRAYLNPELLFHFANALYC